jgi:hypothetical protein
MPFSTPFNAKHRLPYAFFNAFNAFQKTSTAKTHPGISHPMVSRNFPSNGLAVNTQFLQVLQPQEFYHPALPGEQDRGP